jgi:hypothetical protein
MRPSTEMITSPRLGGFVRSYGRQAAQEGPAKYFSRCCHVLVEAVGPRWCLRSVEVEAHGEKKCEQIQERMPVRWR